MVYFIGGSKSGDVVDQCDIDKHGDVISKQFGQFTGITRQCDRYIRTQVSFHGTVKTFYILEGCKPIEYRDQILALWESVKTDIYAI